MAALRRVMVLLGLISLNISGHQVFDEAACVPEVPLIFSTVEKPREGLPLLDRDWSLSSEA